MKNTGYLDLNPGHLDHDSALPTISPWFYRLAGSPEKSREAAGTEPGTSSSRASSAKHKTNTVE